MSDPYLHRFGHTEESIMGKTPNSPAESELAAPACSTDEGEETKKRRGERYDQCLRALSAYSDAMKGTHTYYEVNKLLHRLWNLSP